MCRRYAYKNKQAYYAYTGQVWDVGNIIKNKNNNYNSIQVIQLMYNTLCGLLRLLKCDLFLNLLFLCHVVCTHTPCMNYLFMCYINVEAISLTCPGPAHTCGW